MYETWNYTTYLWNMPAAVPPLGVAPGVVQHGANDGKAIGVLAFCAIAASTSFCLRLGSRVLMKKAHIEDALFVSALGLYGGFLFEVFVMEKQSYRLHTWNMSVGAEIGMGMNSYLMSLFYGLSVMLIKVAILLSWIRLFVPTKQRTAFFWISHALIWSNVFLYGVGTILGLTSCQIGKMSMDTYLGIDNIHSQCADDMTAHAKASGYVNLLSDIVILLLPQRVIWKLHVSWKQKMGMSLLFVIGVFAIVASAVRIYYLYRSIATNDMYYGSDVLLWMAAEIAAGFMIMGFPSLPKVFKALPGWDRVSMLLRYWSAQMRTGGRADCNSRRGLPSWYKPASRKPRRDPMAITTCPGDTRHDLVFVTSTGLGDELPSPIPKKAHLSSAEVC